jgi:hypothetical protein
MTVGDAYVDYYKNALYSEGISMPQLKVYTSPFEGKLRP